MGSFDAYLQGVLVHQSDRDSRLARFKNDIEGVLPSYTTLDISGGFGKNDWSVDLFISNATGADETVYHDTECIPSTCQGQIYGVRLRPTTISARFTKDFN
jgi:outer membrane receptor protein involved in Fe transport